jgi:hypothetical protein
LFRYGSGYVFSKKFFTGWIVVGILWMFCSGFTVVVYPLWEGRHTMTRTFKAIVNDITGKSKPTAKVTHGVEQNGSSTPTEKVVDEKVKAETDVEGH